MKSSRLPIFARLMLLTAAAGGLSACVHTGGYYESDPYYGSRAEYSGEYYGEYYDDPYGGHYADYDDYWYYPAVGAYYDPRISLYFYYEHNHWVRARELPPHYRPYLGHHVVVRSPHDRPYAEHHRHRERYAPDRYREERYSSQDRRDDVWIGPPRQTAPERERHEYRRYDDARYGNKNLERERSRERYTAPAQPRSQEPVRVIRKEEARERNREADARQGYGQERRAVREQPQYRERTPTAVQPPARARTQDMPRPAHERREPPADAAPARQQDQAAAHANGNEAAKQGKREDGERRGNSRKQDDADSRHGPRDPKEGYDNGQ